MDVGVGYFGDPVDLPGLAHFCEHMLFIGSKKFQSEGAFQSWFSIYSGSTNAYTSTENTNYHFQVQTDAFETVLERWAQFFIDPLFSEESIQAEINAVNNEFMKNKNHDQWRVNQVLKSSANSLHPFSKFSTGSTQSLSKDFENLIIQLKLFYSNWYTSKYMNLVLMSNHTIDELKTFANSFFSSIKKSNEDSLPLSSSYESIPVFLPSNLQKLQKIVPISSQNTIYFNFPLGHENYLRKSTHYLSYIVGSEHPNSLSYYLKKKKQISDIISGIQENLSTFSIFFIKLSLTPTGLDQVEAVINSVFCYFQQLSSSPISKIYYDELSQLGDNEFTYQEKPSSGTYVSFVSNSMRLYEQRDWLKGRYIFETYDDSEILSILNSLIPSNSIVQIISTSFGGTTNLTEPWYGTQYSEYPLQNVDICDEGVSSIVLPDPNEWIPKKFDIYQTPPGEEIKNPKQFSLNNEQIEIPFEGWYEFSTSELNSPKTFINVLLRSPYVSQNPQTYAIAEVYISSVLYDLQFELYSANIAGYFYSIQSSAYGIIISCNGWSEKIFMIFDKIVNKFIGEGPFSDVDLAEQIKLQSIEDHKSFSYQSTYLMNVKYLNLFTRTHYWSESLLGTILSKTKLSASILEDFWFSVISHCSIQFYAAGNIKSDEVMSVGSSFVEQLWNKLDGAYIEYSYSDRRFVSLPIETNVIHGYDTREPNSASLVYLQGDVEDIELSVLIGIMKQGLSSDFFIELRTVQQLGYIVVCYEYERIGVSGILFMIQSSQYNSTYLYSRILSFLDSVMEEDITEAEFELWKGGYISTLRESSIYYSTTGSMYSIASYTWSQIIERSYQFHDYVEKKIQVANSLNSKQFNQFKNLFLSSSCRKELTILIDPPTFSDSSASSLNNYSNFVDSHHLYPIPSLNSTNRVMSSMSRSNSSYYSMCRALRYQGNKNNNGNESSDSSSNGASPGFVLGVAIIVASVSCGIWYLVYYVQNKKKKDAAFRRLKQLNEDIDQFAVGEDPYEI